MGVFSVSLDPGAAGGLEIENFQFLSQAWKTAISTEAQNAK